MANDAANMLTRDIVLRLCPRRYDDMLPPFTSHASSPRHGCHVDTPFAADAALRDATTCFFSA